MYSSITPSAKHVNHSITRRDFTLQCRLSNQLNQQVSVLWKVANCLGKLLQGSKRRFPNVHQHRVVISRAGPLARHGSAKFQSQPIGYLKDRSASIAAPRDGEVGFITARLEGDQAWDFSSEVLATSRSDKAGPPRPVFEPVEHVPCAAHAVQCVSARTLHCLRFWLVSLGL
jgi:hypothetical protein